jgi:hypothetical protein
MPVIRSLVTVAILCLLSQMALAQQRELTPYETYEAALVQLFDRDRPPSLGEVRIWFTSDGRRPELQVTFYRDSTEDGGWSISVWYRPAGSGSIYDEVLERYTPTQAFTVDEIVSWANVRRLERRVESREPLAAVLSRWNSLALPLAIDTTQFTDQARFHIEMRSGSVKAALEVFGPRSSEATADVLIGWLRSLRQQVERILPSSVQ